MKKRVLITITLFASFVMSAQQTHHLNWFMGVTSAQASITIEEGDTVIWTFTDAVPHSVTSNAGSTETFDSGIQTGGTFSYTFTIAGTNPYRCIVHPSMVGTITVVPAPPACPDPSNLTASNITEDSVDISWTENGTATEWELEYGPDGFTQGSGTVVPDNDGTLGETLTGLTSATEYDVYVRSICGAETSNWIGPQSFLTDTPSGVEEKDLAGFYYFPNPVKNEMIFSAKKEIETISIYNILGRKVFETHPNQATPILQVSNFQPGVYIMTVVINGSSGTYKFIKK
ncbi:MAG TPA: T9SS type A sorting domain-containing protein [Flavobacteriaceae bacterium]|nr:T9SS type A sorting domain-containing protein [Flavobacteriaceae bacterium]